MDVEFASKHMRTCYEQHREAARTWGEPVARKYIQRVGILLAARTFADLYTIRSLRLHPLRGGRAGQYAIDLHDRWRLILTYVEAEQVVHIDEVSNHYGD